MTQQAINEQLEAIKKVCEEVHKSKESARQFLIDAGIIKVPEEALDVHPKFQPGPKTISDNSHKRW